MTGWKEDQPRDARGQFDTSPEILELYNAAAKLRATGMSYAQIAKAQGISVAGAHLRVQKAFEQVPMDGVDELRRVMADRHDLVVQQMVSILVDRSMPAAARVTAARTIVMADARLARSFGTDAPQRMDVRVSDEMDAEIRRLAAELEQAGVQVEVGD